VKIRLRLVRTVRRWRGKTREKLLTLLGECRLPKSDYPGGLSQSARSVPAAMPGQRVVSASSSASRQSFVKKSSDLGAMVRGEVPGTDRAGCFILTGRTSSGSAPAGRSAEGGDEEMVLALIGSLGFLLAMTVGWSWMESRHQDHEVAEP
jgi:hypothetical protein